MNVKGFSKEKLKRLIKPSKPEDIFRPTSPINDSSLFARRTREEKRFQDSLLEIGTQILIFGDTGVGKTSLVSVILKEREKQRNVIFHRCRKDENYISIFTDILSEVKAHYESDRYREKSGSISGKIDSMLAKVEAKSKGSSRYHYETIKPELISLFIKYLKNTPSIIVLDDFEKIQDKETKIMVANLCKNVSDISTDSKSSKIILIGIARSATELIEDDLSLESRLIEINVPLMSKKELSNIINLSKNLLDIEINKDVKKQILYLSNGYPKYVHLFCLESTRIAHHAKLKYIDMKIFERALIKSAHRYGGSFKRAYLKASYSRSSSKGIEKYILHAMALLNQKEINHRTIKRVVENLSGEEVQNIHSYLSSLMDSSRKSLIFKPRREHYSFCNQMMKSYIRYYIFKEKCYPSPVLIEIDKFNKTDDPSQQKLF